MHQWCQSRWVVLDLEGIGHPVPALLNKVMFLLPVCVQHLFLQMRPIETRIKPYRVRQGGSAPILPPRAADFTFCTWFQQFLFCVLPAQVDYFSLGIEPNLAGDKHPNSQL
jgi:hypothetical protein